MVRLLILSSLILAACVPHHNPCDKPKPCPEGLPHLCDCRPFQGGGAPSFAVDNPAPAPVPEPPKPGPKPEKPKHEPKEGQYGKRG